MSVKTPQPKITLIPIERLRPSAVQPRTKFDSEKIEELARSISVHGVLQPLIVRKNGQDSFEIVAGERRFRAALLANQKRVPCIIMNLLTENALAVALVENVQREDLNPIEEAHAYHRLKETLKISQEEIAERVGKDRASIANIMRLLRLPKMVQDMVVSEALSMGHARALLSLENTDMILMVAKKAMRDGLSVRRLESLIRSIKSGQNSLDPKKSSNISKWDDPLYKEIQQKLEYVLGTKVELKKDLHGYAVTIYYTETAQLNGLLDNLGVEI